MSKTHIWENRRSTGDGMTEKVNRVVIIQRKAEKAKQKTK